MLDKIAHEAIASALSSCINNNDQPNGFRIEIPQDHPKAAEFIKLVRALAEEQVMPSGIRTKRLARPDAANILLNFIEKEFGISRSHVLDEVVGQERSQPLSVENLAQSTALVGKLLPIINQLSKMGRTQ